MLVTDISLCQFYREISKRAKNKNYVWIISLIARHADAKEMYEKLEQDWTSIDNLTNDKILFVFSTNLISNSISYSGQRKLCWENVSVCRDVKWRGYQR